MKNVRLFRTPRDAEREGFRACRRCRPVPSLAARACAVLRDADRITLRQLADRLDVSPHHLQRTFTRAIGVSPARYLAQRRFERFRSRTRAGVTSALFEAGFGSASRLYERARARLGMTPAASLNGGPRMTIAYDFINCPLGKALVAATPKGICAVEFGDSGSRLARDLADRYPRATIRRNPDLLRRVAGRLRRIFDLDPTLPLDVRATAFQARVWNELRSIPAGKTRSYSEIARRIGRPGSARAVASACASNRVAVLIPCHRAVASNGGLSGYRWGVHRKKALLERERRANPASV